MSDFDPRSITIDLLDRLRHSGFALGVSELLLALEAIDGGWGTDQRDDLHWLLERLWCHSTQEALEFSAIWNATQDTVAPLTNAIEPLKSSKRIQEQPPISTASPTYTPPAEAITPTVELASRVSALPVVVPFSAALNGAAYGLEAYWPVTRRSMIYMWRYLRRMIADGRADVLDVPATVERAARQGFFLAPIYRRRERNRAHLMLWIDQDGSMTPFHRFSRNLVDTARFESDLDQVDVFFFRNAPMLEVYTDPFLLASIRLDEALATCSTDTSVLIISDAGAARGHRNGKRIVATAEFLHQLEQRTALIAWLNPMPMARWTGTSAESIAHRVAMFQMDADGMSSAIDLVRGQPLQHYR